MNYKSIITSFAQHGFGNCTSIGVIKAAIEVFGVDKVFEWQHDNSGSVDHIKLRNKEELLITSDDLQLATKYCGFKLPARANQQQKVIRDYAIKCFAVICKSKQIIEEYDSYLDAVDDVNAGENVYYAPRYLGLEKYVVDTKYRHADDYGGIVAHSTRHTIYVSHGYYDNYGKLNKLNSIGEWMRFGRRLYRFKD